MERYQSYKDSGVQWLGEIPSHWKMIRNKSVLSLTNECVGDRTDITLLSLTKQGVIVRDLSEGKGKFPKDFATYLVVEPKNLVFCLFDVDETPRTVGLVRNYGMLTGAYTNFRVDESVVLPEYIYNYYLQIDDVKGLKPYYTGLRKVVKTNTFLQLRFPLPPLSEQQAIVSYLDDKCAKIDKMINNKCVELQLYREAIEALIYDSTDSKHRQITSWERAFPIEWKLERGKALFEEVKIKGLPTERFLAVTQERGLIYKDTDDVNFVTAEKKETQKLVCPDQYVISLRSFEGGIEYSDKRGLVSPAYVVIQLREGYDTSELKTYFRFLFKSKPFVQRLNTISDSMRDGKSIKFSDIKGMLFPVPSEESLARILSLVRLYDKKKSVFVKEKSLLLEYKQRLISDVVTGQVKVC